MSNLWYNYAMLFFSSIKRNQGLVHSELDESQNMLNKRSQTQKTALCISPFIPSF